jgi:hypothetical protein
MNRREFIAALGGAPAWPIMAQGEQATMSVICCLVSSTADLGGSRRAGELNIYKGRKLQC